MENYELNEKNEKRGHAGGLISFFSSFSSTTKEQHMGKYLDIARKFEARRAEDSSISAQRPATPLVRPPSSGSEPSPWPCRRCGKPAEIEAVEPSLDGQRMLTLWNCQRCQVWAVTPSTLREPPVWVSSKEQ
jgi:hypothetical protein